MTQKICIAIPGLAVGGRQRSMIKLTRLLKKEGYDVVIVTFAADSENVLAVELPPKVPVVSMGGLRSANPLLWWKLRRRLRALRPDVVIGWSTYANLVVSIGLVGRRPWRLILSERNYLPKVFSVTHRSAGIRRAIVMRAVRFGYPRADVITANSAQNVRFMRRFLRSSLPCMLLPNVIDVADVNLRSKEAVAGLPEIAGIRLVAVARLEYQKGIDILIRAMNDIVKQTEAVLIVVGSGSELGNLQQMTRNLGLEQSVVWIGEADNPFPYYRWADIAIVPSRHEGFPNVPIEAMATGTAVVCADCQTGPRELTGNGRFGRLVTVDDPESLAKAVVELSVDEKLRTAIAAAGQKFIAETYGVKPATARFREILAAADASW